MKRTPQVKMFEGTLDSVEGEINEFIQVFSTDMIRDIKIVPGGSPGIVIALVQFESLVF